MIKDMYGLKQATILAQNQLKTNLAQHGSFPIPHTVGMWKLLPAKPSFAYALTTLESSITLKRMQTISSMPSRNFIKSPLVGQETTTVV